MSTLTKKELHSLPGVSDQIDAATTNYVLQQTMLRIRSPKESLDFYTRILGMTLIARLDFNDMKFSLYFLAYVKPEDVPEDPVERARWMFGLPGVLELTHNHGTETDPEFEGYHDGNAEPKGFGHIGISVPSVEDACKRFEELGVSFVKKPNQGKMQNLAFIKDPDGYWIEVLQTSGVEALVHWPGNA